MKWIFFILENMIHFVLLSEIDMKRRRKTYSIDIEVLYRERNYFALVGRCVVRSERWEARRSNRYFELDQMSLKGGEKEITTYTV